VLTELSEHATVDYIKALEEDRKHYKEKLSVEVKRHNDLRVAFNAKKRQLDK